MKTSSLGDVIHNLPVVSDIKRQRPDVAVDWCVEENFAAIPRLHPGVDRVIPVALRRWRKRLGQPSTWREIAAAKAALRAPNYDLIIDTQGLSKSALLAKLARAPIAGYAADSIREPFASRFYQQKFHVAKTDHAVRRNRQLVAAALAYDVEKSPLDYGIAAASTAADWRPAGKYLVLLSATSRDDKLWPENHWIALGLALQQRGLRAIFPSGSAPEQARAQRLAAAISGTNGGMISAVAPSAIAAPPLSLPALAALLSQAEAVVGVDTGLSHLAVAVNTPTIALYTATDPGLTGVLGTGFYRNLGGKAQCPTVDAVLESLQAVLA